VFSVSSMVMLISWFGGQVSIQIIPPPLPIPHYTSTPRHRRPFTSQRVAKRCPCPCCQTHPDACVSHPSMPPTSLQAPIAVSSPRTGSPSAAPAAGRKATRMPQFRLRQSGLTQWGIIFANSK
jgi:hypothetical protein